MKNNLTEKELERLSSFIASGDRIEAISVYISLANCGLTEAQKQISALATELAATNLEGAGRKKQPRRSFFRNIVGRLGG